MNKKTLYILLGIAAVGGAWYYMKKKKKGTVTVSEPEKISEEQYTKAVQNSVQPSPMKSLLDVVKKVSTLSPAKKLEKQKLQAAKALQKSFGTPKKAKKVKSKKVGEISVLI